MAHIQFGVLSAHRSILQLFASESSTRFSLDEMWVSDVRVIERKSSYNQSICLPVLQLAKNIGSMRNHLLNKLHVHPIIL